GALVPYKRVDLAVDAFNASGRRLLIIGDGPAYRRLRHRAGPSVTFTGRVPDHELASLLARARGLVMPMVEDFGIIAVEAQAAGTPVIAYAAGGALETVIDGDTGVLFHEQSVTSLNAAVDRLERMSFDVGVLRRNAVRFDARSFAVRMRAALDRLMGADSDAVPAPARAVS